MNPAELSNPQVRYASWTTYRTQSHIGVLCVADNCYFGVLFLYMNTYLSRGNHRSPSVVGGWCVAQTKHELLRRKNSIHLLATPEYYIVVRCLAVHRPFRPVCAPYTTHRHFSLVCLPRRTAPFPPVCPSTARFAGVPPTRRTALCPRCLPGRTAVCFPPL